MARKRAFAGGKLDASRIPVDGFTASVVGMRRSSGHLGREVAALSPNRAKWPQVRDRLLHLFRKLKTVRLDDQGRLAVLIDIEELINSTAVTLPEHFDDFCRQIDECLLRAQLRNAERDAVVDALAASRGDLGKPIRGCIPAVRNKTDARPLRTAPVQARPRPEGVTSPTKLAVVRPIESGGSAPAIMPPQRAALKVVVRDVECIWHRIQRIMDDLDRRSAVLRARSSRTSETSAEMSSLKVARDLLEAAAARLNDAAADLDAQIG
jgi:hypothetical protein